MQHIDCLHEKIESKSDAFEVNHKKQTAYEDRYEREKHVHWTIENSIEPALGLPEFVILFFGQSEQPVFRASLGRYLFGQAHSLLLQIEVVSHVQMIEDHTKWDAPWCRSQSLHGRNLFLKR